MRDGGEIGSDLEREERESARVERLIDRIGWKIQASRDLPLQPSSDINIQGWREGSTMRGLVGRGAMRGLVERGAIRGLEIRSG